MITLFRDSEKSLQVKNKKNKTKFVRLLVLAVGILFLLLVIVDTLIRNSYAHHILQEIQVEGRPMRLSINDGLLFVSSLGNKPVVSVINTTTDRIIDRLNMTSGVFEVEGVPSKNKVYVAPFEGGRLEVYDFTSKNLIKTIQIPHAEITFTPPLADRLLRAVTVITGVWSMDYNPNNERLYAANYNANEIVIIDTKTDSVIGTIAVPAHPITVKVDPLTNTVLVTSLAGNKLTFVSTETNKITKTLDTGTAPWGMQLDSQEHKAYITNRGGYYVTVVDLIGQNAIARIPMGAPAQAITIDTSEHAVYTSYMEQDKILKIDGTTNSIISTIEMGLIPQDVVADSKSHKLYASTKYEDKVFVVGPRSIALSIPVVTLDTPTAVAGIIRAHSQDVQVSEPFLDTSKKSIVMNVSSPDGGDLTLTIPRAVLDAKQEKEGQQQQNATADSSFRVLIDGTVVNYAEEKTTMTKTAAEYREITFFVPNNSKYVEVIGTDTSLLSSSPNTTEPLRPE